MLSMGLISPSLSFTHLQNGGERINTIKPPLGRHTRTITSTVATAGSRGGRGTLDLLREAGPAPRALAVTQGKRQGPWSRQTGFQAGSNPPEMHDLGRHPSTSWPQRPHL